MKPNQAWQAALGELQLQMTKATYDTWVKQTTVLAYEDGIFVIAVRSNFAKEWLENRLMGLIKRTLTHIMGRSVEVRFIVQAQEQELELSGAGPLLSETVQMNEQRRSQQSGFSRPEMTLNDKYTFESFIVGASNRLAHAAARAVAEKPAAAFNPLFLYGGVGLGKTHLLHAVGHFSLQQGRTIRYVSSEQFTNDLINAIRTQTTVQFREKYRSVDVLLIDDIQFIAGKESTQEEFFHTFNTLHAADRQIVVSSDRPARSISPLEERLRSRFEGGLMADVSPPDLETRIAILRTKADFQDIRVPAAILEFIARKVQSNIRELEGSLNRVVMYSAMTHKPMSIELAAEALRDIVDRMNGIEPRHIIAVVAEHYQLSVEDVAGKRRTKEIVTPRQLTMYLLRSELNLSYPKIGECLGGRDHTTAIYACEKIKAQIEEDTDLRSDYLSIRDILYNGEGIPVR